MDAEPQSIGRPAPADRDNAPPTTPGPRRAHRRNPDGQLRLLNTVAHPEWQLDDTTRAVGRRGVAQARAALHAASSRRSDAA